MKIGLNAPKRQFHFLVPSIFRCKLTVRFIDSMILMMISRSSVRSLPGSSYCKKQYLGYLGHWTDSRETAKMKQKLLGVMISKDQLQRLNIYQETIQTTNTDLDPPKGCQMVPKKGWLPSAFVRAKNFVGAVPEIHVTHLYI